MCFSISQPSQVLIRSRILRENGKYIPKQVEYFFIFICMLSLHVNYPTRVQDSMKRTQSTGNTEQWLFAFVKTAVFRTVILTVSLFSF